MDSFASCFMMDTCSGWFANLVLLRVYPVGACKTSVGLRDEITCFGSVENELARQAGLAAHAVSLTADLQRSNEHLSTARSRLVTAREEERRRLRPRSARRPGTNAGRPHPQNRGCAQADRARSAPGGGRAARTERRHRNHRERHSPPG